MSSVNVPLLVALAITTAIALAVVFANPRRSTNQCFLILSLCGVGWLLSLNTAFSAATPRRAELAIRASFIAGTLILPALNLLRLSIREKKWSRMLIQSWPWFIAAGFIILLCTSTLFIRSVQLNFAANSHAPRPAYGPGFYLFQAFGACGFIALSISSARDLRNNKDRDRAELAFILVGALVVLAFTIVLSFILRLFIDPALFLSWLAPLRAVLFSLVVAYGIATRKIMEVGFFLRRLMSYAVLSVYLLLFYGIIFWLVATVTERTFPSSHFTIAHVVAALATTFMMIPVRGFSQSLADKLFIGTRGLDFRATMNKAAAILESVTTLSDLLRRFATTIADAVGTDGVAIFLLERQTGFHRAFSTQDAFLPHHVLPLDGPFARWLALNREPLVLDELHRIRATPAVVEIEKRMEESIAAVALGIYAREHLTGMMLLAPRLSGRIYGTVEQNALQVLCGQLAVAIENAELFTEVQNAKIYNEILLENLTTGVVASDTSGRITVFNHEAEKITGLTSTKETTIDQLPEPLSIVLKATIASEQKQVDRELTFTKGSENVYVHASSSIFHSEDGKLLGALMVVTDVTTLKKMEQQIRRSDRLASLGTLSAGMAHEIKNPLVSIKTFAQLLPERYEDSDFRDTFSSLITHEIDRIDSLVNQLLRFARPAKPLLRPMHVHEILEKTLLLVQHRLYQKEIKVTRSWDAKVDTIHADSDQLEQVFLNFFLNAMDAMKRGGELQVKTEIRRGDILLAQLTPDGVKSQDALRISIRDTGEGIRAEDLTHVFDPFFTTKDYGTGLGLSVVHGIVQEHGGQIEVESELKKGTVFHISLPLARFDEEVVAA